MKCSKAAKGAVKESAESLSDLKTTRSPVVRSTRPGPINPNVGISSSFSIPENFDGEKYVVGALIIKRLFKQV
jgi:hypothetical protein